MYTSAFFDNSESVFLYFSGRVHTKLRWCGKLYYTCVCHYFMIKVIKNHRNRLRLVKFIIKYRLPYFLWNTVYIKYCMLRDTLARRHMVTGVVCSRYWGKYQNAILLMITSSWFHSLGSFQVFQLFIYRSYTPAAKNVLHTTMCLWNWTSVSYFMAMDVLSSQLLVLTFCRQLCAKSATNKQFFAAWAWSSKSK